MHIESHANFHHLFAEIASAPISSEASFFNSVTCLKPNSHQNINSVFWRSIEQSLAAKFPGKMLDEIVLMRDRTWYSKNRVAPKASSITAYVRHLSQSLLESHGYFAMPSTASGSVDEARSELAGHNRQRFGRDCWYWLCRSMPSDILVCAQEKGMEIHHLVPALDKMLQEDSFAQIHVHLGAAMPFSRLWNCILNVIRYPGFSFDAFSSPGTILDLSLIHI